VQPTRARGGGIDQDGVWGAAADAQGVRRATFVHTVSKDSSLIEVVIPLLGAFVLSGLGMIVWRTLRGAVRNRGNLVLRLLVVGLVAMMLVGAFDDGPAAGYTEEILGILEAKGIQATFFVTGEALAENLVAGRQIVAAGHELGNHSYTHRRMIGVSYRVVQEEIERTDELIRATGYGGVIHFRPPYGKRFIVLPYYLRLNHRQTIYWDIDPESYGEIARDSRLIEAHVLESVRPGSIILLHVMGESRAATMEAVPGIIDGLLAQSYQFVTVSELLGYAR
jgi:peptidoglycan/xylan/chitin deacetylase (PgdA/CDA1 family)